MSIIIGPTGKYSEINDPKAIKEWLAIPGFRQATPDEERTYFEERRAKFLEMQYANESKAGVYISTVSEGGKDGYSIASGAMVRELNKLGVPVKKHYQGQKIAILFHNPYSIPRIEAPYRILYTMFESDRIPDDWVDYLQAADEVWVPSKWCQKTFMKAGIKTTVIPLGYDDIVYKPIVRTPANKERRDFTFLHYNAFNIRKGFTEVFRAFIEEFGKTEPVKLILKTTQNQSPLPITKSEYPNIECIYGKIDNMELYDIMKRSDVLLFPSRGEGFGIPPLECMATGMGAIVPNAHGISEYFDNDYMYEVAIKEKCPALYARYKNQNVGEMIVCDIDSLRKQMRWCFEHQDEVIQKGLLAQEYVKQWTYTATAKRIKLRLDDILSHPIAQKKLANILMLEQVK